ncbi:hypothetical protein GCM10023335_43550 [Streptomyces siamensis]|uniref:Uncharacterized protein n=1 Tax=Streptomyces siamensis TaxID=1274986 RepID=A0ABP9J2S7_9ACTN
MRPPGARDGCVPLRVVGSDAEEGDGVGVEDRAGLLRREYGVFDVADGGAEEIPRFVGKSVPRTIRSTAARRAGVCPCPTLSYQRRRAATDGFSGVSGASQAY